MEKSLEEVWSWKEAVYYETKGLSKKQELEYFKDKSDSFLKSAGFNKRVVSNNVYRLEKQN